MRLTTFKLANEHLTYLATLALEEKVRKKKKDE